MSYIDETGFDVNDVQNHPRWFLKNLDLEAPDRITPLLESRGYLRLEDDCICLDYYSPDRKYPNVFSVCGSLIAFYKKGLVYTVRYPDKVTGKYSWGCGTPQYAIRREYQVTFEKFVGYIDE